MRQRLSNIAYWLGILSLSFLVVMVFVAIIGGFFEAYQPLPEGQINFWNGFFGLFVSIVTVILTASIGKYIKNQETRTRNMLDKQRHLMEPYCTALRRLIALVHRAEEIDAMTAEEKQQEREKWVLEWNKTWKEIRPLVYNLKYIPDKQCREQIDKTFGIIYKHVTESIGSMQDIDSNFRLVMEQCDGCQEIIEGDIDGR